MCFYGGIAGVVVIDYDVAVGNDVFGVGIGDWDPNTSNFCSMAAARGSCVNECGKCR